jgi:hypothetical protein
LPWANPGSRFSAKYQRGISSDVWPPDLDAVEMNLAEFVKRYVFILRAGGRLVRSFKTSRGEQKASIRSCCNLIDIRATGIGAALQSLFPFEKNYFMSRRCDGTRHLAYFIDQFVGRFKDAASELTFSAPKRKKSENAKSGENAGIPFSSSFWAVGTARCEETLPISTPSHRSGSHACLAATTSGKMFLIKNFAVKVIFGSNVWITGKWRGDQNMTIIAFGGLIILVGLECFSSPAGNHYYL